MPHALIAHRWPCRTIAAAAMVLFGASWGEAAETVNRPNVVVIVADDLGYHDLGSMGNRQVQTPHLDRLAAEGVRATSFYVTWPACTPSRASLLTGRYPQRNGLYDMIRNDAVNYGHRFTEAEYSLSPEMTLGLDLREVTLAQPLHSAGYACGMVGKWDSGRARRFLPLQRGFDFFHGFANTGIDYWTHERYGIPSMFRGNERIKEEGYATDLFGREAVRFVKENQQRPFFLYLAFNAPHSASNLEKDSYQAPAEAIARYTGHDPRDRETLYLAMISRMDDEIGRVLQTLRDLKIDERTLVLFFSDNGGAAEKRNSPLRGKKAQMFEGGIRVPLVARWPGRLPAGRTTDEFLTSLEIYPTALAAAGAPTPAGVKLDGFDMLPILAGDQPSPRREMFWQRRGDRAARVGPWKWVESEAGDGLFDLAADPGESRDLSAEKPDVLANLRARFEAWRAEMDASEPRGPFRDY